MFEKMEDYLTQKIQKFVDRIYDVFGVTKYRLAIWLIITAVISTCLADILEGRFDTFDIGADLFFAFITFFIVQTTEQQEREFLTTNNLHPSIASFIQQPFRFIIVFVSFLHVLSVLYFGKFSFITISILSNVLWMYVDSCVPRRPRKSKVRKWIDGMLTSLGEMLEPTHDFAPTRHN